MKVTSYEISKKLKEIGFNKESHAGYMWDGDAHQLLTHNDLMNPREADYEKDILAYDLETILEALPEGIEYNNQEGRLMIVWDWDALAEIYYEDDDNDHWPVGGSDLTESQGLNESLADMAARFLILLHEKGLINFK